MRKLRKTPLAKLKRQADALAASLCHKRKYCQSCGNLGSDWSHIVGRTYYGTRWNQDNCLLLCRTCHYRFTCRPDSWIAFLEARLPGRHAEMWLEANKYHKVNRNFVDMWITILKFEANNLLDKPTAR